MWISKRSPPRHPEWWARTWPNIVNEAALNARAATPSKSRCAISSRRSIASHLGFEKKGRLISKEEKDRVAYHEVGHTLVALSVPNADPVRRVSIIPRSIGALGHTLQLPTKDRYLLTEPELEDRITVLLGGRGAEDIIYNGVNIHRQPATTWHGPRNSPVKW